MGLRDAPIGGRSKNGIARLEVGEAIHFSNLRMVGMTREELHQSIAVRVAADGRIVILPDDILQNQGEVRRERDVSDRADHLPCAIEPSAMSHQYIPKYLSISHGETCLM